jgi:ferric-dicitrate binding protein FerR (iron transport regulator)
MREPIDRERARTLMMAALDDEISDGERAELKTLIAAAPDLDAEWRRLARVKEVTSGLTLQPLPEELWDRYWASVYARVERGLAWILVSAGAIVITAYAVWQAVTAFFADTGEPLFVRVAIAAVAVGATILLLSVVREKFWLSRRDPYQKEITR